MVGHSQVEGDALWSEIKRSTVASTCNHIPRETPQLWEDEDEVEVGGVQEIS